MQFFFYIIRTYVELHRQIHAFSSQSDGDKQVTARFKCIVFRFRPSILDGLHSFNASDALSPHLWRFSPRPFPSFIIKAEYLTRNSKLV